MSIKTLRLFIIITLCLSQIACSTIIRGTHEDFRVNTNPVDAKVSTTLETQHSKDARKANPDLIAHYHNCPATPCEFKVPRRTKFVAIIEKDGFYPVPVIVNGKSVLSGQATALAPPAIGITATGAATVTTSFSGTSAIINAATIGGLSGASNIFAGGVLSAPVIAVDAVSGSMLSLTPNPLDIQLTPISDEDTIAPANTYDLDTLSDGNDTWGAAIYPQIDPALTEKTDPDKE